MNTIFKPTLILILFLFNSAGFCEETSITYYVPDASGSPIAAMDEQGNVKWRKHYKPFGEEIEQDAASKDNRIGYTGHVHDRNTGLTYMGARYYDPVIGRFMSMDPVGFKENNPMSFNRYLYVNNNPYKYKDPDGRELTTISLYGGDKNNPLQNRTYLIDKKIATNATSFATQARNAFPNLSVNNAFRIKSSQDINTTNTKSKTSRHQGGFALDLNGVGNLTKEQRTQLDKIAANHGFGPAINREKDLPHYSSDPKEYGYKSLNDAISENRNDYNKNFKDKVPNLYE